MKEPVQNSHLTRSQIFFFDGIDAWSVPLNHRPCAQNSFMDALWLITFWLTTCL